MTVMKVYEYPHPILKKKAEKVEKVDDELRRLLDDMLETCMSKSVSAWLRRRSEFPNGLSLLTPSAMTKAKSPAILFI